MAAFLSLVINRAFLHTWASYNCFTHIGPLPYKQTIKASGKHTCMRINFTHKHTQLFKTVLFFYEKKKKSMLKSFC